MKHGFEVVTTPTVDGKIVQELYSVEHDIREQVMRRVMDTQEQHIRDALIALGWTPPEIVRCRCGGQMKPSSAIESTYTGKPEWPGDTIYTMSPGGPGRLIACLKCEKCGHSISDAQHRGKYVARNLVEGT